MSCNHCTTKFSFFHKELGCANCGLSFCSKCLKQKCKVPSKGSGEYSVCRACYSKITSKSEENSTVVLPPDRFLKRLENLENPGAPPITVYKQNPKICALKSGLSSADQQLVDRLEKLKEKPVIPPSDQEIRERLAKLKDVKFFENNSEFHKPLFLPDTRSEQEKVDSLLEQYSSEQDIRTTHESHDDLGQRLATLKGEEYKKNIDSDIAEPDSEEEVDQIRKKIMAEVSLDQKCELNTSKIKTDEDEDDEPRPSSPELPWCVLCNNDAKYRCLDCSGDLYCSSCNTEVHKTWGDTDHRVIPYKQK